MVFSSFFYIFALDTPDVLFFEDILLQKECFLKIFKYLYKKRFMNTEEFIEKAKKVHGDKYDYSKVEYVNEKQKSL